MDVASQSPVSTSDNQSKDVVIASKNVSGSSNGRTARAQRSLRRQAHGTKEIVFDQGVRTFKKYAPGANIHVNSSSISVNGKVNKTEEVVKVKLNTGTLLLYKGHNRRAVFLRRC
jgi:hypothetical protein